MEIVGTNQEEKDRKTRKLMIWITIIIIVLFLVSIVLAITINLLKKQLFKFSINGSSISNTTNDLFVYEEDETYVSIKDIAQLINYTYFQGQGGYGYEEYSEAEDKCYLKGQNEICTFEENETTIYKILVDGQDYQNFTINKPIKRINDKLYITAEGLQIACNLKLFRNVEENRIAIYTLPYYANYYTQNNKYSAISNNFNNQKAILYGLLVTQSVENTTRSSGQVYYGVSTLAGEEIVGKKYTSIQFVEGTQEFIVGTEDKTYGIVMANGITKVQPRYDSLKQIDKDLNLYLAISNGKQGIIEKNGKILIYPEYDKIGINASDFKVNNIKNPYVLYSNAIPAQLNGKWGMFDVKGNKILDFEYDGFGCVVNSRTANSILLIPNIKAIVVSKIYDQNRRKETKFGVVNYLGRPLVVTQLDSIYATIANGRTEYKMDFNGQSFNVIETIYQQVDVETVNDPTKSI